MGTNRADENRGRRRAYAACLVAALAVAWPTADSAASGATSIAFEAATLHDLGIAVDAGGSAPAELPGYVGFGISDAATLHFSVPGGDFEEFGGGSLLHTGTLTLAIDGASYDLSAFELRATGTGHGELDLFDASGRRWLQFQKPQPLVTNGELHLQNVDVNLAPELAALIGRPDLAASYIGSAHVRIPIPAAALVGGDGGGAQGDPCADIFTADRDVSLEDIGTVSQLARIAAGPVALTFSARLRNVGTSAIVWKSAIEPDGPAADVGEHPFLALHVYRIANGRVIQIGRSDIKHAFFSTNTVCSCAGGHVIYPDCEDTYGASTNANRLYLGPRSEVSSTTGDWTSLGSHFDDSPVDDFRHHGGNSSHDDFEHRLLVDEGELQAGGAYYVEAWYLIRDDVDLFNSMGHDPVTPSFAGSTWSFTTTGAIAKGSILDEFVDPVSPPAGSDNTLIDTGVGRLQLAVATTDLGGAQYHYEYALMNYDFDRKVRSFSIPLEPGLNISNIDFRDADIDAGNDWTVTTTPWAIYWTAPVGNELDWGTLFSFGFDADAAPVQTDLTLGTLEPGAPAPVQTATLGPSAGPAIPTHLAPLWVAIALLGAAIVTLRVRAV